MLDTRLGRFLSLDRYASKYPFYSPYSFAANSPILAVDFGGDSIYIVNGGQLIAASLGFLMSMNNSSDVIKDAYSSSTHNIYIVQSSDGSAAGSNIANVNAYTNSNGTVIAKTPDLPAMTTITVEDEDGNEVKMVVPVLDEKGNQVYIQGRETPAFASNLVGVKVDLRDKNEAIFVNYSAIEGADPVLFVAGVIAHEAEAHLKPGASHSTFGVGSPDNDGFDMAGSNPLTDGVMAGSCAAEMKAEAEQMAKKPAHKTLINKFKNSTSTPENRSATQKQLEKPKKYEDASKKGKK